MPNPPAGTPQSRLCVPCANGRCYRCIGETANGPDTCACACKGQQRDSTLVDAGTPNAVEEARKKRNAAAQSLYVNINGEIVGLEKFEAAVRTQAFAEVRRVVEGERLENEQGLDEDTAYNLAITHVLAALTALQNKDTNTHTAGSEPSVGGGAK